MRLSLFLRTAFPAAVGCVAVLIALVPSASAQTWSETGEAGDLISTAQTTVGAGTLTKITGQFANVNDVDLYCIKIPNPGAFYAGIVCAGNLDPNIWLFDGAGVGLSHQDLCQFGDSDVNGTFVPSTGFYYLAVGCEGRQAQSPSGPIWLTSVFNPSQRPPDGSGAPGPLVGWAGSGIAPPSFNYTVNLLGAQFCDAPVPARTGTWGRVKIRYR